MNDLVHRLRTPQGIAGSLAVLLCLLGVALRARGLSVWPLAEDEFYQFRSVEYLLTSGLPIFPCGGVYERGLLLQYMVALATVAGLPMELAIRWPSLLGAVLAMPPAYLIGKRLGGPVFGLLCLAAIVLSTWEIEYARFGRFYMPFQAIALWHVYALLHCMEANRAPAFRAMLALTLLSVFVFEGAVFLAALNILPLITRRIPTQVWSATAVIVLLALSLASRVIDFHHLGAGDYLPAGVDVAYWNSGSLPLILPEWLAASTSTAGTAAVFGSALVFGWLTAAAIRRRTTSSLPAGMLALIVAAPFLLAVGNLLLLTLIGAYSVVVLVRCANTSANTSAAAGAVSQVLTMATIGALPVYLAWAVATFWSAGDSATGTVIGQLASALTSFPEINYRVVYQWYSAMPIWTVIVMASLALAATADFLWPEWRTRRSQLLLFVVVFYIASAGAIATEYAHPKYSFHFYPLAVFAAFDAWRALLERFVPGREHGSPIAAVALVGLAVLGLVVAEDYRLSYLTQIASAEQNFRLGQSVARQRMVYPRFDYRSPGEYIDTQRRAGDVVISVRVPVVRQYVDKLDYMYWHRDDEEFPVLSACQGTRATWTDAALLFDRDALYSRLQAPTTRTWVVFFSSPQRAFQPEEDRLKNDWADRVVYTDPHGAISVALFEPAAPTDWTGRPD